MNVKISTSQTAGRPCNVGCDVLSKTKKFYVKIDLSVFAVDLEIHHEPRCVVTTSSYKAERPPPLMNSFIETI